MTSQWTTRAKVPVLHMAPSHGDIRIVQLLLQYGARTDVEDGYGLTAVQVAEEKQHSEIMLMLRP